MVDHIIRLVTEGIIHIIGQTGYAGIFGLMAAESALIPIPSEVTMTFAGYLASIGRFNLYAVAFVGAFANLAGSILAYALGYWGEEHVVRSWIRKYGKWILVSEHDFDKSDKWFKKHGEKIVFFSRVLPIVRTFISLPAGIAQMNFWRFSIFTFLGSLIWSSALVYVGFILGENWHSLEIYYRKFEYVIVALLVIGIIAYIYKHLKKR